MNTEFEFRLYYDEAGRIVQGETVKTTDQKTDNRKYVVATRDEYYNLLNYRVVNNKLELIKKPNTFGFLLEKRNDGKYKVVKNNAPLLIEEAEEYENIEYYDIRNH